WEQTGDGAVQTNVEELARWDANFTSAVVGGRTLLDQIQTPAKMNDGTTLQYAMGLFIDSYRGFPRVQHGGAWGGFRAMTMRFPAQHLSVLLTCNRGDANTTQLATNVADVFLPKSPSTAALAGMAHPGPGAAGEAARFAGVYVTEMGQFAT